LEDYTNTESISELREIIKGNPDFCRDEKSITRKELHGYLGSGITLYALNGEDVAGILNFEIKSESRSIYIYGICVPPPSSGIGTALIDAVKTFAVNNSIREINLTCYDSGVSDFYSIRNGFRIISESKAGYDSDDEDDEPKTKYEMRYVLDMAGGRIKSRRMKSRRIKSRRIKTRRMKSRNKKNTNNKK
jgi:hypothetical protein